jgi:glycosyltransferase involved in cell wall biosynthesis
MRLRRGIESYVWNLTSALAESGVEVDILTWPGPVVHPENGNGTRVALHLAPSVGYYEKYFAAPYYCSKFLLNRYDHVVVNFAGYGEGPALRLINSIKAVRFSVVFHFPRTLVPHRYLEFERWGFSKRAHNLIGVSDFVGQQVENWAHRPVSVIGHGVDTKRFKPDKEKRRAKREELGVGEAPLLLTAAALEERKGIQWVVRALPDILAFFPDTYYVILGEGSDRAELERLIRELGLENHVWLKGAVDDVEAYLSAADIGVLLSKEEALGISVVEYAASGLPVITSKWPPFDELVNAEWGVAADETNSRQLAEIITGLLADPEKRTRMGSAGRLSVETNHSWQQVAHQYRQLIG